MAFPTILPGHIPDHHRNPSEAGRGPAAEAEGKQTTSDSHSPARFRVDGPLRNVDAWYEAFAVKPGDKLYLKPEERVRIW